MLGHQNLDYLNTLIRKVATNDFTWILDLIKKYGWALEFVVIILITMIASYLELFLYHRMHDRLLKKKKHWEHGGTLPT